MITIGYKPNIYNNQLKQNVSFKGNPSKFAQEFRNYIENPVKDENNTGKLIDIIKETVFKMKTPENELGSGQFGRVYKIDDEFVFKTPHSEELTYEPVTVNENPLIQKLKTYYGDFIAKFGNVNVMKNAVSAKDALPAGVKEGIQDSAQMMSYYRDVYLKRFTALPQKAFDDIAEDFKTISKERKSFDTINPNNFLADGDKLKITDDIKNPDDKFFNSLAGMMKVFLTSYNHNTQAEYDVLAVGGRRNILRKIILAGEKHELDFGFTMPERKELNEALRLCDIETPWRDIQADLCNFRRSYPNMDERLKKVNEYIDELETPAYNYFMY